MGFRSPEYWPDLFNNQGTSPVKTINDRRATKRRSQEDCDDDPHPIKRIYRLRFDVEDMIDKLQGPRKVEEKARLVALKGEAAIEVLDSLQSWLDSNPKHNYRRRVLKILVAIASASNELPMSLFLNGVELSSLHPASYGAYADVFQGTYRGTSVAVKRLRVKTAEETWIRTRKQFCREGITWRQLKHPNVLPFLGVEGKTSAESQMLTMVSPWMDHGTLMEYLCSTEYKPHAQRSRLIQGVAEGLHYIHSQGLVHGDLHGSNIFISGDGCPFLADFGLMVVHDITVSRTMIRDGALGSIRWSAPELVLAEDDARLTKTLEADVFSFGRVCLAICTRQRPFHGTTDTAVIMQIMQKKNPLRPTLSKSHGLSIPDELWNLMVDCWAYAPMSRPTTSEITAILGQPRYSRTMCSPGPTPCTSPYLGPLRRLQIASPASSRPSSPESMWSDLPLALPPPSSLFFDPLRRLETASANRSCAPSPELPYQIQLGSATRRTP